MHAAATSRWWTARRHRRAAPGAGGAGDGRRARHRLRPRTAAKLAKLRRLPAETTDGEAVELQANLELPVELPLIAQSGAQGIGLLRTEFLFMNRETCRTRRPRPRPIAQIVEAMGGDPVTIRVLDWGGEKDIEALSARASCRAMPTPNPALGLRGIRLLLRRPELLETQFAAILRAADRRPGAGAAADGDQPSEVRAGTRDLRARGPAAAPARRAICRRSCRQLGIMIETPGAALSADALALEADFFAIGTNDLAVYTLAVDRAEAEVADLYDPLHPAVLRLMQFATEAALRLRMPVSVCGEMAGNPRLTPLLLGLGLRRFSMNASAVPRVKQAVRAVEIDATARGSRGG